MSERGKAMNRIPGNIEYKEPRPTVVVQLRVVDESKHSLKIRRPARMGGAQEYWLPRTTFHIKEQTEHAGERFILAVVDKEVATLHWLIDPPRWIAVELYEHDRTKWEVLLSEYTLSDLTANNRRDLQRWVPLDQVTMKEIDPERGKVAVSMSEVVAKEYRFEFAPKHDTNPQSEGQENVEVKN